MSSLILIGITLIAAFVVLAVVIFYKAIKDIKSLEFKTYRSE